MSVIFSACYGVRLENLEHPIMVMFYSIWEEMLKYFQPGSLLLDFFPILQRLPKFMQPWMKLADSLRAREIKLHRAFLRTLNKQVQDDNAPTCFGTLLVKIQEKEGISDERACDILAMLTGAGADTTSSSLQSFFKVMALHPEVALKAQAELDSVVGQDRLPTWEDEQKLSYVRAIIKEVHRWAPIGSLGVPHATSDSDVYEGKRIPKDTIIFPNLTKLSRDSERYEEADYFLPERFLGDNLDASSSALHPDWKVRDHFHYGFGRRLCQGIFVAEASLYIAVSRLLWGFNITPVEGEALDMDAKITGLVTKPQPYRVSIKSRSPGHEDLMRKEREIGKTDILNFDNVKLEY
ncbi:cytochrome P450 [Penicillium cosmopolitanum]|uniref:Cytochrome P450 n=1 Tax=Penicillium cosmopolitanum TaxID=1131564 RepID=A0A9W9SGS4_9EURO|nr:cytochrome P450 [Penicillium cosmopolitanum]KAJ5375883.1 cytochrome P450 [Penicillium cosmopolitanum]